MKLGRLRALIAAYKKQSVIGRLFGYPSALFTLENNFSGNDDKEISDFTLLNILIRILDPSGASPVFQSIRTEIGTAHFVKLMEYLIQNGHFIQSACYDQTKALPDTVLKDVLALLKGRQFTTGAFELYIAMGRLRPIYSIEPCLEKLTPSQKEILLRQKTPYLFDYLLSVITEPLLTEPHLTDTRLTELRLREVIANAFKLVDEQADFSMDQLLAILNANNIVIYTSLLKKLFGSPRAYAKNLAFCLKTYGEFAVSNLQQLTRMSDKELERVLIFAGLLKGKNRLTQQTFDRALSDITVKLPPCIESTVVEQEQPPADARIKTTLDKDIEFFTATDRAGSGGFGMVRKAFESETSQQPIYAVKRLHNDGGWAKIEAKYNRLLGRQAFFFRDTIVYEWQEGIPLYDETRAEKLLSISQTNRLKCLRVFFAELNTLHQAYRIHGDLTPPNLILNMATLSLHMIDMGSARKLYSPKAFFTGYCYTFTDGQGEKHTMEFCDDIYAAGLIVALLFPELYEMIQNTENMLFEVKLRKSNLSNLEEAIVALVNSMRNPVRQERCFANNVLAYCDGLIEQASQLDQEKLKQLSTLLNHEPVSYEETTHQAIYITK